jgi:hypothetical protein
VWNSNWQKPPFPKSDNKIVEQCANSLSLLAKQGIKYLSAESRLAENTERLLEKADTLRKKYDRG